MSVLPVTDALRRLEVDGLVESRARAGTRVRVPSDADIHALYEPARRSSPGGAPLRPQGDPGGAAGAEGLAGHVDTLFTGCQRATIRTSASGYTASTCGSTCSSRSTRAAGCSANDRAEPRVDSELALRCRRAPTPLPASFTRGWSMRWCQAIPTRPTRRSARTSGPGLSEIAGEFDALTASEWRERKPSASATTRHESTRARNQKVLTFVFSTFVSWRPASLRTRTSTRTGSAASRSACW